jgi:branched-chain amino acid transport system permease protein
MQWVNAVIQGVLLGGLYALFAAGLSLIFGIMGLVNVAHGDLIVLFAYMAYFAAELLGIGPFASLLCVVPVAAVTGYILQRGVLNRTLGTDLPPLLVTFGLSIIIQNLLLIFCTADGRKLQAGAFELASWKVTEGLSVGLLPLTQFLCAVVMIAGVQVLFYRTALGRAFRATSDDPSVAQLMGLETKHIFSLALSLSLAMAAVAGVFMGIRRSFDPSSGPLMLIFGFEAIIIGGMGSLWGTLAGGIVLGVAQTLGAQINVAWPILAGHAAFLVVLLIRPQGMFPKVFR